MGLSTQRGIRFHLDLYVRLSAQIGVKMNRIIGIDIGTSAIKIAGLTSDGVLFGTAQGEEVKKDIAVYSSLDGFLTKYGLEYKDISKIILTGVGASYLEEDICGIPTSKISEIEAIGCGGLELTGLKEALVVSMGTGTAFVHIGGTGVGGGTLAGLSSVLLQEDDLSRITQLADQGNILNVDLVIKDISKDIIPTLPLDLTASNFGKLKPAANREDMALGLFNMVYQVIGMLSVFACRNDSIQDVILVGTLAKAAQGKVVFERIGNLFNLNFLFPEEAPYAVAIGAVVAYLKNNQAEVSAAEI